jgi:hypothetical protein
MTYETPESAFQELVAHLHLNAYKLSIIEDVER